MASFISVADSLVYFGDGSGNFVAVDSRTGAEKWRFKTKDRIFSSPAIADGVGYIGSDDGYLYALTGTDSETSHAPERKSPMKGNRCLLVLMLNLGALSAFAQDQQISPTLASLFDAERTFAKRCGVVGIRASFLEFFADEAVVFRPHAVNYKEAIKDRPAPPNPLAYALEWEPIFGEVSAAGDMGYDTGPSVFTDKTAEKPTPNYGFFFSVWKKQADGNWKVVLDVGGAQTTAPYTGSREAKTAPAMKKKTINSKVNVETERANLLNAERAFLKSAQTDGMAKAFAKHLSQYARVHRNGVQPILGQDEIVKDLARILLPQRGSRCLPTSRNPVIWVTLTAVTS